MITNVLHMCVFIFARCFLSKKGKEKQYPKYKGIRGIKFMMSDANLSWLISQLFPNT